jgi:hypothetical protein
VIRDFGPPPISQPACRSGFARPFHDQRMGVTAHQLNHLMMPKCLSTSEPESTLSTDPPAAPSPLSSRMAPIPDGLSIAARTAFAFLAVALEENYIQWNR